MAGKAIQVDVTVVPTSGKPSTKSVEVPSTGATLAEVLTAADISPRDKDLYLDDEPATLATHVKSGQKVKASSHEVRVEERPAGS